MRRLGLVVVNRRCFEQLSVYCLFDIQGKRSRGENRRRASNGRA